MSNFKMYQQIMILGTRDGLDRVDMGGKYLGAVGFGPKKGMHKVEINSTVLHFPIDQIMDYVEYMDIYLKRSNKPYPEKAVGRPWFVSGDYKG